VSGQLRGPVALLTIPIG